MSLPIWWCSHRNNTFYKCKAAAGFLILDYRFSQPAVQLGSDLIVQLKYCQGFSVVFAFECYYWQPKRQSLLILDEILLTQLGKTGLKSKCWWIDHLLKPSPEQWLSSHSLANMSRLLQVCQSLDFSTWWSNVHWTFITAILCIFFNFLTKNTEQKCKRWIICLSNIKL